MPNQAPVLDLLRHGVPLSLLMDLASAHGPDSVAIAHSEANKAALTRQSRTVGEEPR